MNARPGLRVGWIGTGRMGQVLATRLLEAGYDVAVYNRTRAKTEPLAELGASVVDTPAELADRDLVFTMVGGDGDFEEVILGDTGLLSRPELAPRLLVDLTTISPTASARVRLAARRRGTAMLAAPVSGNPKVAAAGRLTIVVSGPPEAWEEARPYVELLCAGVTYVGDGDRARLVKICHNLMLGIVAQCLSEITVLAEKGGVARADFLTFLNGSVMGSMFTRYKSPAIVNLDFTPSFTSTLLLKDFHLGFEAAHELGVPMPLAATAEQIIQSLVDGGYGDLDFQVLLELAARGAGLELVAENVEVDDGLSAARGEGSGAAGDASARGSARGD